MPSVSIYNTKFNILVMSFIDFLRFLLQFIADSTTWRTGKTAQVKTITTVTTMRFKF